MSRHTVLSTCPDLRDTLNRVKLTTPGIRWAFGDGSALVQYVFQITAGVHRSRLDAIRDDYAIAARRSLERVRNEFRTKGYGLKYGFSAQYPAFARADDDIYSHQPVLPASATC